MINVLFNLLISIFVTAISIPIIIHLSNKYHIYDRFDLRKIHKRNISRLGGLGIFLGFIISFSFTNVTNSNINIPMFLCALVCSFLIGFIDDIKHINANYKLFFQILIGIIVTMSGLTLTEISIADITIKFGFFSHIITVFLIIFYMNLVNLIDGIDGLASGIMIIAFIFYAIISLLSGNFFIASIAVIMAGALTGFFIFNFPPAKIFMGDGGAYFIGFSFGSLTLMDIGSCHSIVEKLAIPLIVLLIPVADFIQVINKRIKTGSKIFSGDRNHLHHLFHDFGFSPKCTIMLFYMLTVSFSLISLLLYLGCCYHNSIINYLPLFALIPVIIIMAFIIQLKNMIKVNEKNRSVTNIKSDSDFIDPFESKNKFHFLNNNSLIRIYKMNNEKHNISGFSSMISTRWLSINTNQKLNVSDELYLDYFTTYEIGTIPMKIIIFDSKFNPNTNYHESLGKMTDVDFYKWHQLINILYREKEIYAPEYIQ